MSTEQPQESYLSVRDIAKRLNVSDDTVRRWIHSGSLPALGLGGQYRVSPKALQEFLDKQQVPLPSKPRKKRQPKKN